MTRRAKRRTGRAKGIIRRRTRMIERVGMIGEVGMDSRMRGNDKRKRE